MGGIFSPGKTILREKKADAMNVGDMRVKQATGYAHQKVTEAEHLVYFLALFR